MSNSSDARTYFGHISLYFPNLDCVITGDAAVQENRELVIANPNFVWI